MAGLSQTIAENWAVIREAPEAFAVLIVVIIGVVWATLHFLKARVETQSKPEGDSGSEAYG
jgi:hypothetical protein